MRRFAGTMLVIALMHCLMTVYSLITGIVPAVLSPTERAVSAIADVCIALWAFHLLGDSE